MSRSAGTGQSLSDAFWLIEHVESVAACWLEKSLPLAVQVSGTIQERRTKDEKKRKAPRVRRCNVHYSASSPEQFSAFYQTYSPLGTAILSRAVSENAP